MTPISVSRAGRVWLRWSRALRWLPVVGLANCADGPAAPSRGPVANVRLSVSGARNVRMLAIEVTGPGIDSVLVYNILIDSAGLGAGVARVPAGTGRHFVASAFDAAGIRTHQGDTTITLVEGANAGVALKLRPLLGTLPITMTFGGAGLILSPSSVTVSVGDTVRFGAGGVDSLGNAISPAAVIWSSTNPSVVLLGTAGLSKARSPGAAFALATFQGLTVGSQVTVVP